MPMHRRIPYFSHHATSLFSGCAEACKLWLRRGHWCNVAVLPGLHCP